MTKNKKAFLLYHDSFEVISELSDEQAGKLLKALFDFSINGTELQTDDGMLRIVWKQLKTILERDSNKYEKTVSEQANKAKIGGIIRALKEGNRISQDSIDFLSNSNIGKEYLEKQGISQEVINDVWKRIESTENNARKRALMDEMDRIGRK